MMYMILSLSPSLPLQLDAPVMVQGNVEVWLGSLRKASFTAVHSVIRQASVAIADLNFDLMEFENAYPAQVN